MPQPLAAQPDARGSPLGVRPPVPRSAEHAASVRRHPSSSTALPVASCPECSFRRPARSALTEVVAQLPELWSGRLESEPTADDLDAVEQVRDELHVVANRVERLLTSPGVTVLASVAIDAPRAQNRALSASHLRTLLDLAADRLVTVLQSIEPGDWQLRGRIGSRRVGVDDLVAIALHRSHARLVKGEPCR